MTIQEQIADVVAREGGFVNHPADRGGPTRYGITQAVARAEGYRGDMAALPIAVAQGIYFKRYWVEPRFDMVAALAPVSAAEMFDTGVNCGPATATMLLQRALNIFTGSTLKRDGAIVPGGATLATLSSFMAARRAQDGDRVLCELLNAFQGDRYAEIVERDPSQRDFVFGWIRNRVMARAA